MNFPIQESVWEIFSQIIEPFFSSILANNRESRTLAQLRDLLLPKRMSGEIRPRDAGRLSEGIL